MDVMGWVANRHAAESKAMVEFGLREASIVEKLLKAIGMVFVGSMGVFALIVVLATLGPLVGYLSGSIFQWMMPESSTALLKWIGAPDWAHGGHIGAGLAFIGVFFRVTRNDKN